MNVGQDECKTTTVYFPKQTKMNCYWKNYSEKKNCDVSKHFSRMPTTCSATVYAS